MPDYAKRMAAFDNLPATVRQLLVESIWNLDPEQVYEVYRTHGVYPAVWSIKATEAWLKANPPD